MKDYLNVIPDKTKIMGRHFTPGRGGRKIRHITRHHTAGVLTTEQVWDVWQTRQASAHYIVETDGTVGQLVWDRDTSWANANLQANQESITIEHSNSAGAGEDWPISDATILGGARLAAALCRFYQLGRPEYGVNIRDHREWGQTSCPYHLAHGGKYHARWMGEAQRFYDELTTPKPPAAPHAPSSSSSKENPVALIRSLVNSTKSFAQDTMLALIDRATWEVRVIVNELARKQGLDPDQIVADAIRKDNEK